MKVRRTERQAQFGGYEIWTWHFKGCGRLEMYCTGRRSDTGKEILGYAYLPPRSRVALFSGANFGCAPNDAVDSKRAAAMLLAFLTLQPGDTDADYFASYTQDQLDWTENSAEAEELRMWTYDTGNPEANR